MSGSVADEVDLGTARSELAALRDDVALLLAHLRGGAQSCASSAAGQIKEGVDGLSQRIAFDGGKASRVIGAWVVQRPAVSLLVAVGIGYIGGRLLRR
jgi:hypothetical protein